MDQAVSDRRTLSNAIFGRRAVRSYTPEVPPDSVLELLLDAAVQAPTAMHEEQWSFVIVQDPVLLKSYSDRAKKMMLEQSRGHPELLPAPAARMLGDPAFNIFYNASTLIVICRNVSGSFVDADCWLAAENLMLDAYAQGLGTCCIGFAIPALNTPDVKMELGIPEGGAAVVPIIVGYPGAAIPPIGRKPPHILRWIRPELEAP